VAGQSKDKEKKPKDDSTAQMLRRLAEEIAALRADVEAVKSSPQGNTVPPAVTVATRAPIAVPAKVPSSGGIAGLFAALDGEEQAPLPNVEDSQVAKLGYALSSAPKVALLRLLFEGGEQSAAQLGEKAGLTTGSLYHHLRELIYANVITQESRNRYRLTTLGRRAMRLLSALASTEK
jgi:DNA-binding transcriptional ArsR family regulator